MKDLSRRSFGTDDYGTLFEQRGTWRTGLYYTGEIPTFTTGATSLNWLLLGPLWVPRANTPSEFAIEVTTAVANALFRICVYTNKAGDFYPDALLVDSGQLNTATTGVKTYANTTALPRGWAWIGGVAQTATSTIRIWNNHVPLLGLSATTQSFAQGYYQASVTGAPPATFTSTVGISSQTPKVLVKAA